VPSHRRSGEDAGRGRNQGVDLKQDALCAEVAVGNELFVLVADPRCPVYRQVAVELSAVRVGDRFRVGSCVQNGPALLCGIEAMHESSPTGPRTDRRYVGA
jgi:hypothetical protein